MRGLVSRPSLEIERMFDKNILAFDPGWDSNAQKLAAFADVRDLQRQLKAQGLELKSLTGRAWACSFTPVHQAGVVARASSRPRLVPSVPLPKGRTLPRARPESTLTRPSGYLHAFRILPWTSRAS
jgi:hypothetical protein